MDSDLSLLEITAEDDSLLHIPKGDTGFNNASTIFSCSPLHCHRSVPPVSPQTDGRGGAVCFEKFCSSVKDVKNKENIDGNKSEVPKLNVEPQQMKRKKKGGGFNLRKSLAWDRAFFSEKGVLNPLELSMISGSHSRANNELTMIDEEEENALVSDADIVGASSMLKDIEENLFKPLPEDRKNGASLSTISDALTKDTFASAALAKRKALAVNNINRNKSKGDACPRPTASSSLKRPDTSKAQRNESKVSKRPLPKTHVPVITAATRSGTLGTGSSKRNQHDSAAYVQKNAAIKVLSGNPKIVPINGKSDVADNSSVTRTNKRLDGKDINGSTSQSHPPLRLQYQTVTEARKSFELHPPLRVCNTVDKKQPTQFQTARPSGLRMPSPSLGFFSQSQQKASSSHSVLHKSSKPCKHANIPKLKKVEMGCVNEALGLHSRGKTSETYKGEIQNCNTDVKSEPCLQVENNQKIEVQCYSLRSGEITAHGKVETIPDHMNNNDKDLLLPSDMDKHLKTKVDEYQFVESHSMCYSSIQRTSIWRDESPTSAQNAMEREVDGKMKPLVCDALISNDEDQFVEPHSMCYSSIHRTSIGRDELPTSSQNAIEREVDVKMKPPVCDAQISNEGSVPQAENGSLPNDFRHSGDLQEFNCLKIAQVNSSPGDFSEAVLGVSLEGIPCKGTEGVKYGVSDFDKHEVDAQLHLLNANLSSHCNDSSQIISLAVNPQPQSSHSMEGRHEEQYESINSSIEAEINSRSDCEFHANGCLVHATTSSSQESPKKPLLQVIDDCENAPKIAEIEDCQHTVDVQSGSVHRRSMDNEYDQIIDSKLFQDISSKGTLSHYDLSIGKHDVLGNFDQQAGILASSKLNNILCENEISVANHGPLLDESDSFKAPVNINLDAGDFCGVETPSILHEKNLSGLATAETDDVKRHNENLHVKDTSLPSSEENPVICSGNSYLGTPLGKSHFPLVVESINKESAPEIQRPDLVADVDILHLNLNGNLLPPKIACSEEMRSEILFEGILGQYNNNASDDIILKNHIIDASEIKDGSLELDESTKHLQIDAADQVTAEIVDVDPDHKISGSNIVSSIQGNEGYIVDWKCIEPCSSNADNLISHRQISKSSEVGSLKRKSFPEEAEIGESGKDENCSANVQNHIAEDGAELFHLKKSGSKRKQDVPAVIPLPNVAPFSDEWLAAMEAAGEEILTMKGGAVQNSPTEKLQHEPGPWSPVRRKNQAIGPYDCTKYTNINIPDSCQ